MASFWERTLLDDNSMLSRLLQKYEDAGGVNWFTKVALNSAGENWYTRNVVPFRIRDIVTNGTFDDTSAWTVPTGVAITGGALVYSSPGVSTTVFQDATDMVAGQSYEFTFTISDRVTGAVTPALGGTNGTLVAANGTFTQTIVAGGANQRVAFLGNPAADFKIDNVTVMPV